WQSYEIAFRRPRFHENGTLARAARITVFHNGVLVQDAVELWGPTAWLQNFPYKSHPDKLPISLQDHGNPVRYRNIWLRPLGETGGEGPPIVPERKIVELTREQLGPLVGAYQTPLGNFATIELQEGRLVLHMKTGQVIELLPLSPTDFAMRFTAGSLAFDVKPSGAVEGFTMQLGGERFPIRRARSSQ
ncbi:MAG TPA: family 16 glycoside hydrolase, partial [Pirellulales bacterium]|nr:family 16 glycoside hydrolase [Pirellulales bacterium]